MSQMTCCSAASRVFFVLFWSVKYRYSQILGKTNFWGLHRLLSTLNQSAWSCADSAHTKRPRLARHGSVPIFLGTIFPFAAGTSPLAWTSHCYGSRLIKKVHHRSVTWLCWRSTLPPCAVQYLASIAIPCTTNTPPADDLGCNATCVVLVGQWEMTVTRM